MAVVSAQPKGYWHGKERQLRYTPEGEDFVIVNGDRKFNRALYGTNTAFRVETGDIPEFGLFMPNMGGNIQLGLIKKDESIWLNDAEYIKSIYRSGSRIYEIKDPLIDNGKISITVLAMAEAEGVVMKIETFDLPVDTELLCMYGGANNKRFSRNGDLGVDEPDAFALNADACENNLYKIIQNAFSLEYGQGTKDGPYTVQGVFPEHSEVKQASPYAVTTPCDVLKSSPTDNKPVLVSIIPIEKSEVYYIAVRKESNKRLSYSQLEDEFNKAESRRKQIAGTVRIKTPDPYFNTLGGVLSIAADGIWDDATHTWQHGAVGWRMPLNGWRAAYVGDAVGWHERTRKHFDGYAASQITDMEPTIPHPSQDQKLNLARAEKNWGTQMYSNGYICRNPYNTKQMHHYDMNLVYIDALLWHFNWTGDMDYVSKMWPVLKRHLAWEKRNFDPDDDGLYDAYAGIWASDALQYNSGSVTHSSAYNYRANKMAAEIADKLDEDSKLYKTEAEKILKAVNSQLWLTDKGWWAEYKDFMGNRMIHPNAAVWTVYHAIDSDIHTPFQAYQATRYVDTSIPHIPVLAKGLADNGYHTVSTTNWLPYSWSINNVAFAEVAHTSLAYWQAGRENEAFKLFKSSVLDGMYLGDSPGNIGQVSFYDAARGECYRDFGDPVGVYSRVLVQGLFGIIPDAMNQNMTIRPGFPSDWNHASISTPDVAFDFKRNGTNDSYKISNRIKQVNTIQLLVKANHENIRSVTVNGKTQKWELVDNIGKPLVKINCAGAETYEVLIEWQGKPLEIASYEQQGVKGEIWSLNCNNEITKIYDPQNVLKNSQVEKNNIKGILQGELGNRTLFVQTRQGQMFWWQPLHIEIIEPFFANYDPESSKLEFKLTNNLKQDVEINVSVNHEAKKCFEQPVSLKSGETSHLISIPNEYVKVGTNTLQVEKSGEVIYQTNLINWNLRNENPKYETVQFEKYMNASVSQIFKNEYLTPRSPYTTLQVPKQGIGEWCHPSLTANIEDSGLRKAVRNGELSTPLGVPFHTTGDDKANNIAFTTLWDNYPAQIDIPLTGKASHAYLMMAGSTNHMQCHVVNATITISYKDGSKSVLNLIPPETWAPIEQDFYLDGSAFVSQRSRPYRVAFKTGVVNRDMEKEMRISSNEVYGRNIDGGAGIILDLPLDANKELDSLEMKTLANEVVIGLMGVTLLR